MADIFLSYARADAGRSAKIARDLSSRGYSVWFDADLPAHRAYSDVIEEQLEAALAVVVLWSKDSIASQWVRSEANRARETGRLVQVRLDGARLPMPFDQIQCADLSNAREGAAAPGWKATMASIADLTGNDAISTAADMHGRGGGKLSHTRRAIIGGAAAAGIAVLGGGWWFVQTHERGPPVTPATAALMEQARSSLWQNTREGQNQAIGIYRKLVSDEPTFADGWAHLAMAYASTAHYRAQIEASLLQARARSAARKALALDSANAIAISALAGANPYIGNWQNADHGFRKAVALQPKNSEVAFNLAIFLQLTGRNLETLKYLDFVVPAGPTPAVYYSRASALWAAGRQEDLDNLFDEMAKIYPTHPGLWFTRFYTFMLGGQPEKSLAMAADTINLPTNIDQAEINSVVRVARAIQSGAVSEVDAVTKEWVRRAHDGVGHAENAIQFLAVLGRVDEAFALLRAYYFSEGFDCGEVRFSVSQGTYTPRNDRLTRFLFTPPLDQLRPDARFATLMDDLKLTAYWRASANPPDHLARRT